MSIRICCCLAVCVLAGAAIVYVPEAKAQAKKYQNADEAYRAGAGFLAAKNTSASRLALEEALRLAPDDAFKLKVHRALVSVYRNFPREDKLFDSLDFIIDKSDRPAERSLTRSNLLTYAYARGKEKTLAARYEERLRENAEDRTALYVLSELYSRYTRNAQRAAEVSKQLVELLKKEEGEIDVRAASQLAQQYTRTGKLTEAAELFEQIAPLDERQTAWHWKEAAKAWLKAKEHDKALTAAKAAIAGTPEKRTEGLTFFWHKDLGQIFFETGQFKLAIEHFEKAIEHTNIDGYRRDCLGKLEEAKIRAKQQEP